MISMEIFFVMPRLLILEYQPAFYKAQCIQGKQLGFKLMDCPVHTLPHISGFLGGDILAAAVGADIEQRSTGTLLVDIGTDWELIYKGEHGLYATSCATGPAFEGASLSCGMQAIPGAIDKVILAGPSLAPEYHVIQTSNNEATMPPIGLCGSGVISTTAELYRAGVIDSGGAMAVDDNIVSLQIDQSGMKEYFIAPRGKDHKSKDVVISQKGICSIQLGKAALRTGIEFLSKREGRSVP